MKSAQQQLTELQDRHDEFIKLEKSIKEVHDMFLEIANLVTQQVCLKVHMVGQGGGLAPPLPALAGQKEHF